MDPTPPRQDWIPFNNSKSFLCKPILNLAKTVQPIFALFLFFKTLTVKVAYPSKNPAT